jgi:hypothetical protein
VRAAKRMSIEARCTTASLWAASAVRMAAAFGSLSNMADCARRIKCSDELCKLCAPQQRLQGAPFASGAMQLGVSAYAPQSLPSPPLLQEAPAVLVLQLKRFEFSARSRTKLGKVSLDPPVLCASKKRAGPCQEHSSYVMICAIERSTCQ